MVAQSIFLNSGLNRVTVCALGSEEGSDCLCKNERRVYLWKLAGWPWLSEFPLCPLLIKRVLSGLKNNLPRTRQFLRHQSPGTWILYGTGTCPTVNHICYWIWLDCLANDHFKQNFQTFFNLNFYTLFLPCWVLNPGPCTSKPFLIKSKNIVWFISIYTCTLEDKRVKGIY